MRLLFAHAFIGLLIVAIGINVDDSFPLNPLNDRIGTKTGLSVPDLGYHVEISGIELSEYWGRYHIDSNFREHFQNFRSVDIPASESAFMTAAHDIREISELDAEKHWKLKSLVIEGESITFQTTANNNGESYVFSGTFHLTPRCSIRTVRFEGQLTKIKDDVVVATTNVEFHKVCGC
jgi:hypothetical protein